MSKYLLRSRENGKVNDRNLKETKMQKGEQNMREFNINGALLISVDHGYGNIKSAHTIFKTPAMRVSESVPVISNDYIEYEGKYYIISEGHKEFISEKIEDDDYYVLTLAAIAKELKVRRRRDAKIYLAVGLPLKWVKAQREQFKEYLMRNKHLDFRYKGERYQIELAGCMVMPQCYSAVSENLRNYKGLNLLVDIGNGTLNIMYLNNGKAMDSKSWTEKYGVSKCFDTIRNAVSDQSGVQLMEETIDTFIKTGTADVGKYLEIMEAAVKEYVEKLFSIVRNYEYNPDLMDLHFMGGGAGIVERFGKALYNEERTFFIKDICATAKGYEYFCYMALKQQGR